jgi:16S rRNA (adenine1518-N6/adenine1519-N6)-dimethyltransferase
MPAAFMKLSEMKQLLTRDGIQLTRSLGQTFLHDAHQLRRIVDAACLARTDRVLEIGPGLGPLTELLVGQAGEVLAIEKDARLMGILRTRFATAQNLTLRHDDALDEIQRHRVDWSDWKLVANLPYSVASPILVELALGAGSPRLMVVTLQLEVAQRLAANADDDDYGVLSLLVQLRYLPHGFFKIPFSCFFPEPAVDSACLTLVRRADRLLPAEVEKTFVRVVKRAFSQRRKMMGKLLKQDWPTERLQAAFAAVGLSAQIRAEAVSLEQFARLAMTLHSAGGTRHSAPG